MKLPILTLIWSQYRVEQHADVLAERLTRLADARSTRLACPDGTVDGTTNGTTAPAIVLGRRCAPVAQLDRATAF